MSVLKRACAVTSGVGGPGGRRWCVRAGMAAACLGLLGSTWAVAQPPERVKVMSKVKMYSTGTCPYCIRAKQILKSKGVADIEEIRVDLDPAQRTAMMQLTGRRTVPQIFIGSTHVGGHDDLVALDGRGGLDPLLAGGS